MVGHVGVSAVLMDSDTDLSRLYRSIFDAMNMRYFDAIKRTASNRRMHAYDLDNCYFLGSPLQRIGVR